MTARAFAIASTLLIAASPASAKPAPEPGMPVQINRLLSCRSVAATAERLACFDRESALVGGAVERKDLVVFDRDSVRKTRRSLFGFSVPDLGVFGNSDNDALDRIEGVLRSAGSNRDGGHTFVLEDGSRWSQIDDRPLALEPRSGDKVTVRRGALGSFVLSVGHQPGLKVRRIG